MVEQQLDSLRESKKETSSDYRGEQRTKLMRDRRTVHRNDLRKVSDWDRRKEPVMEQQLDSLRESKKETSSDYRWE